MVVLRYLGAAWPGALLGPQRQAERKEQSQETGGEARGWREVGRGQQPKLESGSGFSIPGGGRRGLLISGHLANLRKD